ncbi:hypothetical protein, conserved [Trypanosoma brucei brucei TREU927]|uniref:Uncharacterized protein n=1 Tax=Trypanosoma brucei brucei (strain 927/4 GUTat10.1) TaxID=185431 RepID=Q381Z8_TRYB2|nr:hypothetical protein, conserved [Trypanosoma brucei brucei TREU927]EAN80383.1 hypothetical protein, conserved [Trypanosoma brucei brucei TREU927]
MATLQVRDFDPRTATHYYHCILAGIPHPVTLQSISSAIVPDSECESVQNLEKIGCQIVPYRLHVFKETLSLKFGVVDFFIHHSTSGESANPAEVHELFLQWFGSSLTRGVMSLNSWISLGQPRELHSATPFVSALMEKCSFFDAKVVSDIEKLRTFILSKVRFDNRGLNAHANNRSRVAASEDSSLQEEQTRTDCGNDPSVEWKSVGTLSASSLDSQELAWLSRQHRQFPSIAPANEREASATWELEPVRTFLQKALTPLVEVVK